LSKRRGGIGGENTLEKGRHITDNGLLLFGEEGKGKLVFFGVRGGRNGENKMLKRIESASTGSGATDFKEATSSFNRGEEKRLRERDTRKAAHLMRSLEGIGGTPENILIY